MHAVCALMMSLDACMGCMGLETRKEALPSDMLVSSLGGLGQRTTEVPGK